MTAIVITPRGPFSLAASMRFLEGFTPAGYRDGSDGRVLRLAFPADDGHSTVSAQMSQAEGSEGSADSVQANVTVHTGNLGKDGMGAAWLVFARGALRSFTDRRQSRRSAKCRW
ncbi:hypothetical protein ACTPOK_40855 [Streptomyces inhibens]|uniref:hypothetical protein n=1 Tax=Streptomyces inhibens TaxID=2293571 RepID=UPI00402A855C